MLAKFSFDVLILNYFTVMFFSKNLRYLRKKNNRQTQEKLALNLGLTRSVISSYEDGRAEPSITTLIKMSEYFGVTIENLTNIDLAHENEQEVEYQRAVEQYANASNLKVKTVTSEKNDTKERFIQAVPLKASAGYTNGLADKEYLGDLPAYSLPFIAEQGNYRAFEIKGDSMLPIKDGSIVIGEYVEDLNHIKDGDKYIVVSEFEGIVLKQVHSRIEKRGTLLLKSSNLAYSPYEIPVKDIQEVWKFVAYIGREFPQEYDSTLDLKEAFARMEYELQDMKAKQRKTIAF